MKKKETTAMTVAEAGRIGGKKSKRILTSEQARAMVDAREKKRREKKEVADE